MTSPSRVARTVTSEEKRKGREEHVPGKRATGSGRGTGPPLPDLSLQSQLSPSGSGVAVTLLYMSS